jgi:Lon protease-like protein
VAEGNVIPLFPLHTVLFPGGPLPLRIFEARYLDMVGHCSREQKPFGVVLIQDGEEAGEVATTATIGCTARIVDFSTLEDGLLGLACVGERKFRVQRVWREADGLNVGEVEYLPSEPEVALPESFAPLGAAVRRAMDALAEHYEHVEKKLDDAAWIGSRLAELLPLQLLDKQVLLEMSDPIARLQALMEEGVSRSGTGSRD